MTNHNQIAKGLRLTKAEQPEKFCPVKTCLYRTGDGSLCPKHFYRYKKLEPQQLTFEFVEGRNELGHSPQG